MSRFISSALHLTEDAIHLSLSPTPGTSDEVANNNNAGNENELDAPNAARAKRPQIKFDIGYRDGNLGGIRPGVGPGQGGFMDSVFGCFKPFVSNFIGKTAKAELQNQSGKTRFDLRPFRSFFCVAMGKTVDPPHYSYLLSIHFYFQVGRPRVA